MYKQVHTCLAVALRDCGIVTDSFGSTSSEASGACFEQPDAEDLLLSGRKVAGAAIRHCSSGVLLQGSIQGISMADTFPAAFAEAIAEPTGIEHWNPENSLNTRVAALVDSRYGRTEWTRRR